MRNKQRGESEVIVLAWIIVVVGWLTIMGLINYFKCKAQWDRSGLECDWGPIQGCMVQLPDGRWLPAEKIREIDIAPKAPKVE